MTDRLRVALTEVSTAAGAFSETTTDYDQLLQTITRSCAHALNSTAVLSLFDDNGVMVTPVAIFDDDAALVAAYAPLLSKPQRFDTSLLAQLAPNETNTFVPQLDLEMIRDRITPDVYGFLERIKTRGFIAITIRAHGENLGILSVLQHGDGRPLLDDLDREITTHLANLAGFALSNARLFRRAQQELVGRLSAEQASEQLRASEASARQANAFLDTVLENIPAMVFIKDATDLSFVRFNRAGEELLGIPRSALIGKSDFDFFPKEEAEFFVAKDRETLASQQVLDIPEEPILTGTGQRWLHTRKVPITDEQGVPRYLLGISHDITRQRRDMALLETARDVAETANHELEAFSYSVAHDLRAPLRAIDGFTLALLEDYAPQLGEVGRSYCVRVRNSAQRMAALIDDLLKLSRVTRATLRSQPVDLGELFRTAVGILQRDNPGRKVETIASPMLFASGDPKLLAIAIDNLVANAWKFTSRHPAPQIELTVSQVNGERVFCISDNGVGFDMTYRSKLFGVFNRLHPESEFPGTGVGLATVQRIITRHGGRVWAEGEVSKGARFYFTLSDTRNR